MPKLARSLQFVAGVWLAIVLTLLLAAAAGLVWQRARGAQLLSVQSASMVPVFRPGDALIVEPIKPQDLKVGQVISYHSRRDSRLIISHRLIKIDPKTGLLTTAGDALHSPDQPFPSSLLVGRAVAVAPGLGRLLNRLRRPLGLALAIYLPAAVIVAYELRRLFRSYQPAAYSLHAWP